MTYAKVQRRVPIGQNQYGSSTDASNFGIFAVGAMDAMGSDIVGADAAWTEMAVLQESASSVRVNFGRIWKDGRFFGNPDATTQVISLATAMPTSTKKIVTIFATGAEADANILPRSFKNTTTGTKQTQNVATEVRRALTLSYVGGAESGSPQPPDLDANYVPIAHVLLGTSGVEVITLLTDYQLPTMQGMRARLMSLETFRTTIGTRVETLASDLASVGSRVARLNEPAIRQGLSQLAELLDMLEIDEGAQLQGFDRFMTTVDSDTDNVAYKAEVYEGIRARAAATKAFAPQLNNPTDPKVVTRSGWTLPVFTEEKRLDIWGQYISVNIANYQYANTSFTIFPGATRRRRYGPSQVYAANSAFWQKAAYAVNYLTRTFQLDGETYLITDSWIKDGVVQYRVQQYWDDAIKYWNGYQSITPTASNGYVVAQTFLNAQAGWLTSVGLRFGRVDPAYGVTVFVCEVINGEPNYDRILATGSIAAGALKESPANNQAGVENKVTLTPVFLEPGKRYGIILVSAGDHAVACRTDNALSNGAFFIGDGTTWVADIGKDMNARLYFAKFTAPYVMVQLKTETLSGGISDIDAITREMVPDGAEAYLMMRVDGVFHRFEEVAGTHPLASLPQTVELFYVMVGTTDVMPAIKLADSKITLLRIDDDFTHLSEVRNAGASVDEVELIWMLAGWDGAKHSFTVTIESGANSDAPTATTDYPQADGTIKRVMNFTLTAPTTTYQIKAVGATTDIADWFVPLKREDLATAA